MFAAGLAVVLSGIFGFLCIAPFLLAGLAFQQLLLVPLGLAERRGPTVWTTDDYLVILGLVVGGVGLVWSWRTRPLAARSGLRVFTGLVSLGGLLLPTVWFVSLSAYDQDLVTRSVFGLL